MKKNRFRYIFLTYHVLKSVKFKKLEKVSDKIYVVVSEDQKNIPLKLVREIQKLGKNIKWVVSSGSKKSALNLQLAFLLGQIHQKVNNEIDFAILSNSETFDELIEFINLDGRSTLRVQHKTQKSGKKAIAINGHNKPKVEKEPKEGRITEAKVKPINVDVDVIDDAAQDTLDRLIASGNRPAEVSMLKSYILLHNQNGELFHYIDDIIKKLEEDQEIEILEGEVTYNF